MSAGAGGCWWDREPCSEEADGGSYYCATHRAQSQDPWDLGAVLVGGDTGSVLSEREAGSDPDLEGGAGRSPS